MTAANLRVACFGRFSGDQELFPFKRQLRQLGQKTAWYLNFDVNAFDFMELRGGEIYLAQGWQRNVSRRFTVERRITMKYPHSIPLLRTNGELLPGGAPSRVVLSSVGSKWNDVVLEQQIRRYKSSVFINCPFGPDYKPLFHALVFGIQECGLIPRCALEIEDSSEIRISKISRLIGECRFVMAKMPFTIAISGRHLRTTVAGSDRQ
jgi:hypothetical protein